MLRLSVQLVVVTETDPVFTRPTVVPPVRVPKPEAPAAVTAKIELAIVRARRILFILTTSSDLFVCHLACPKTRTTRPS
jgi:hypothetical protein